MGIIQKQGLRDIIVSLAGVFLGVFSMLFIYPLNHKVYGQLTTIFAAAGLLVPFMSLGASNLIIKFSPKYLDKFSSDKGLFTFALLLNFFGFILTILILKGIVSFGIFDLGGRTDFFKSNYSYIIIFGLLQSVNSIVTRQISIAGKTAIPSIITNLSMKLILPLIVLTSICFDVSESALALFFLLYYFMVFVALFYYGFRQKAIGFTNLKKALQQLDLKEVSPYAIFSMLSVLGVALAFKIDSVMITSLINEEATGLYMNVLVMVNVLAIPSNSISRIASPIISRLLEKDEIGEVSEVYKKSSINALIISCLMFLGTWLNLDSLFAISTNPEAFVGAKSIFIFLALAKLIDIATSLNTQIITYSRFYKYNLVFLVLLGISNILLNILFIVELGILGAAVATCISFCIYNLLKYTLIKVKFGLSPFTFNTIKLIVITILIAFVISKVPFIKSLYLTIFLKSMLIIFAYVLAVFYSKVSIEFNSITNQIFRKVKVALKV